MRALVTGDLALLSLALAGLAVASHAAAGASFAYATLCMSGVPAMVGTVLMSRGVAAAGLEQTVSQTLGTLSWAPLAIVGSVAAGAVPSPSRWLLALAVACAVAAVVAAVARANRRTPRLA
jgi:hypothetical protein